ncbi:MAG: FAD-dependent oxidoreductase [Deltaproteobacteria bacterium]|nr:FAD-dependent oxidoreductase [Deltaproteobacteria bacterium]
MDIETFALDASVFEESKELSTGETYDLLIIGGGPAAMSAAVYGARKTLNLGLVTKDFGGQVGETSAIDNWLGFQSVNGRDLVNQFTEHVRAFGIPAKTGGAVTAVSREGELFRVTTVDEGRYVAKTIIAATGKRHRPLNVPGEREFLGRGVAYCATCDAPFFKGKTVVVAGGGNSAFTTAVDLLKVGAAVTLVNAVKGWQADEYLQERVRQSGAVRFLDNHEVSLIEGDRQATAVVVKNRLSGNAKKIDAQGIFIEIGLVPNSEAFRDVADTTATGEINVDCSCRTSTAGFFGAGDVTTVPYKQIIIAAGEGAKAALSAYDYLLSRGFI